MVSLGHLHKTKKLFDNRYRLESRLGGGGFSEVWLAYDTKSQNKVALKVYAQVGNLDEDGISMFRNEFSIVCNYNHSNILRPFSFETSNEHPYLVLPYCERGSAASLIGKMSEDELWKFIHDVASGLSYLHSHMGTPVVHQDIKPANVLIDANGQYMITDFGISTGLHRTLSRKAVTSDNEGGGTIAYMAPERFTTNATPLISNDIWSFGATLYELATGNLPFGEMGGLTQSKTHTPPPITENYSKGLKELIYRCLSEKTWDRPSAQEIVSTVEERKLASIAPSIRKRNTVIGVVSAVIVCIIAIITYINRPTSDDYTKTLIIRNDSLIKEEVQQANNIIADEWKIARYGYCIDLINERRIIEALPLYDKASSHEPCSDSAKSMIDKHRKRSLEIVDSINDYFFKRETEYRAIGAIGAAEIFASRKINISTDNSNFNNNI